MNRFFWNTLAPVIVACVVCQMVSLLVRPYMVGKDHTLSSNAAHTVVIFKDVPGKIILPLDHKLTFSGGSQAAATWIVEKK